MSGFDRLVFRGTLRPISYVEGLKGFLWRNQVLLKDFGPHAQNLTHQLKDASLRSAQKQGRPVEYLASSGTDKEAVARRIAERDKIASGLTAILATHSASHSSNSTMRRLKSGRSVFYLVSSPQQTVSDPPFGVKRKPWEGKCVSHVPRATVSAGRADRDHLFSLTRLFCAPTISSKLFCSPLPTRRAPWTQDILPSPLFRLHSGRSILRRHETEFSGRIGNTGRKFGKVVAQK